MTKKIKKITAVL